MYKLNLRLLSAYNPDLDIAFMYISYRILTYNRYAGHIFIEISCTKFGLSLFFGVYVYAHTRTSAYKLHRYSLNEFRRPRIVVIASLSKVRFISLENRVVFCQGIRETINLLLVVVNGFAPTTMTRRRSVIYC